MIYTRLSADAAVTALVADRIYRGNVPVTTSFPCIQYREISGARPINTLRGKSCLANMVYQFDAYGATLADCWEVARTVMDSLLAESVDGLGASVTDYPALADVESIKASRMMFDVSIWFVEV